MEKQNEEMQRDLCRMAEKVDSVGVLLMLVAERGMEETNLSKLQRIIAPLEMLAEELETVKRSLYDWAERL